MNAPGQFEPSPNETVFGSLEAIQDGVLDSLNIVWYHIHASGQSVLCIGPKEGKIERFEVQLPRIVQPTFFETSISGFKNRNNLVGLLVAHGCIPGALPKTLSEVQDAKNLGLAPRNILIKSDGFARMHKRILKQIELVLEDREAFQNDSKVKESRRLLLDAIGLVQTRFGWDPDTLSAMVQQSIDEYFVRNVLES